jgi:DNA-binding transcriptional LysR family regulator
MIPADAPKADELTVQQLRSFCAVYQRQSYSLAAKELGLSVPTVWEHVRLLEKRYASSLFERRGRRIFPTPIAESLHQSLLPLLAGIDSTFQIVRERAGAYPQHVTLVTGVRMMLEELGGPLARFRESHPGVSLRLLHGDDRTAQRLIVAGEADLALLLEPGPGRLHEAVSHERAYQIECLAIAPKDHALTRKRALRLAELVAHPLIVGRPETHIRNLLDQALHREGLLSRLQLAAETDNSAATIACARAGMGVGIVAGRMDGILSRDLATRSLRRQLGHAWIVFLWQKGRQLTSTLGDLMQLIHEEMASKNKPGRPRRPPRLG